MMAMVAMVVRMWWRLKWEDGKWSTSWAGETRRLRQAVPRLGKFKVASTPTDATTF